MPGKTTRRSTLSRKNVREDMRYFNSEIVVSPVNSEETDDGIIVKKALILAEGSHIDSLGRPHRFSADRIFEIAENTNTWFNQGNRIPWLTDHKKTQWDTIGDLEGQLQVRRITKEDIKDQRVFHLVGKLGIFVDKLVGRGAEVVGKVKDGIISTLSPGLDIETNIIKEISATPTPAIAGMRLFARGTDLANLALSWEEAEAEKFDDDEESREQFMEYAETYWDIVSGIFSCGSDTEVDPMIAQQEALDGFVDRILGLIGMDGTDEDPEAGPTTQPQDKNMAMNMAQAAYMMYGGGDRAEFAFGQRRRERERGIRNAAVGAGAVGAGLGAALLARRYGRGAQTLLGKGAIGLGGGLTGAGERLRFGPGGRPVLSPVRGLRNKGYAVTPPRPVLTKAGRRARNRNRRRAIAPPVLRRRIAAPVLRRRIARPMLRRRSQRIQID